MNKKVRWITETAVMLALLVALQALTKGFGQLVTGSCVNAVLAVTVLTAGLGSGIVVAVLSPVLAYLLGIAPQILVLPAIMAGNTVFVVLLRLIAGTDSRKVGQQIAAWLIAALGKFAVLYLIVVKVVCGVMAPSLLAAGTLKEPMLKVVLPCLRRSSPKAKFLVHYSFSSLVAQMRMWAARSDGPGCKSGLPSFWSFYPSLRRACLLHFCNNSFVLQFAFLDDISFLSENGLEWREGR